MQGGSGHSLVKSSLDPVYYQIREILSNARAQAWQAVNTAMVAAYWNVGRVIVEQEQKGEPRAKYGEALIEDLSRRLAAKKLFFLQLAVVAFGGGGPVFQFASLVRGFSNRVSRNGDGGVIEKGACPFP